MLIEIPLVALALSFFLLVWLRTDAFVEYMSILGCSRWFHVGEYRQIHADGYEGNFTDFLFEYYKDNFFVRLLTCPICVSFWLGMLALTYYGCLGLVLAPLTLFFYLLFISMM